MRINSNFLPSDPKNDFWVVSWLGKLLYGHSNFLIEVFLANCSNKLRPFDSVDGNNIIRALMPANYLYKLKMGTVFYKDGMFMQASDERQDIQTSTVDCQSHLNSKISKRSTAINYPFPHENELIGFNYYYQYGNKNSDLIVIPHVVLLQGLFFKSSAIVDALLEGKFYNQFNFHDARASEDNDRHILLEYNNLALGSRGVKHAIKYAYLDTESPFLPYNQIESSAKFGNIQGRTGSYLNVDFPIKSGIKMKFSGCYFNYQKGKSAFLAHELTDFKWIENAFSIERLDLVPQYPGTQKGTSNSKNNDGEGIVVKPDYSTFTPLGDSSKRGNPNLDKLLIEEPDNSTVSGRDLDVRMNYSKEKKKALSKKYKAKNQLVEELSTNSNEAETEAKTQNAVFAVEMANRLNITRYDYIRNLIKNLIASEQNGFEISASEYIWSDDPLEMGIKLIELNAVEIQYLVFEIDFNDKFIYLIEPPFGDTGLIHRIIDFQQIPPDLMESFLLEIQTRERIMNKAFHAKEDIKRDHGIQVLQPVKHQIEKFLKDRNGSKELDEDQQGQHAAMKVIDKINAAIAKA